MNMACFLRVLHPNGPEVPNQTPPLTFRDDLLIDRLDPVDARLPHHSIRAAFTPENTDMKAMSGDEARAGVKC